MINTTQTENINLFEVTYIDSFYCQRTVVVYGETVSAIIRDNTIAWMESVGFKGVSFNVVEAGCNYRGDLDREHRENRHPWRKRAA